MNIVWYVIHIEMYVEYIQCAGLRKQTANLLNSHCKVKIAVFAVGMWFYIAAVVL